MYLYNFVSGPVRKQILVNCWVIVVKNVLSLQFQKHSRFASADFSSWSVWSWRLHSRCLPLFPWSCFFLFEWVDWGAFVWAFFLVCLKMLDLHYTFYWACLKECLCFLLPWALQNEKVITNLHFGGYRLWFMAYRVVPCEHSCPPLPTLLGAIAPPTSDWIFKKCCIQKLTNSSLVNFVACSFWFIKII